VLLVRPGRFADVEQRRKWELKRDVLSRVRAQVAFKRAHPHHAAAVPRAAGRRSKRSDDVAAAVVAAGGGMQDVIDTTGLPTCENALRLIDPTILKQSLANDDARASATGPT
jgi:hypothetical protein